MAERLTKEWTAPIYAFFKPVPVIEYVDDHRCHIFQCAASKCKHKSRGVRQFLDKEDAKSTSNMRKHAKKCWGDEVVALVDKAKNAHEVCVTTVKGALDPQLITTAFERKGKMKYSHQQHTKTEARAEIVRWVAESKRPFEIVADCGFQSLMKTGWPDYYIPSPTTVSRDVKKVFVNVHQRMAKMLQVCPLVTLCSILLGDLCY